MTEPKTYDINTISDIFEKVPEGSDATGELPVGR